MGGQICKQAVIYVFYVKKADNAVTINRQYSICDSPDVHIGAVLDCWFFFDWIISYAPVKPFEATIKVNRVWREAGETRLDIEPKFTNDGAVCDTVLAREAARGGTMSVGKHRVTAIFDTPTCVRVSLETSSNYAKNKKDH